MPAAAARRPAAYWCATVAPPVLVAAAERAVTPRMRYWSAHLPALKSEDRRTGTEAYSPVCHTDHESSILV